MHVLSPGDYEAHDRSDKRIDFVLRNLKDIQKDVESALHLSHEKMKEQYKKDKKAPHAFKVSECGGYCDPWRVNMRVMVQVG